MRTHPSTPNPGQQSMMEMLGFRLEDTEIPGTSAWCFFGMIENARLTRSTIIVQLDDAATPTVADVMSHALTTAYEKGLAAKIEEIKTALKL